MEIKIIRNGQTTLCPSAISGTVLLKLLNQSRLILAKTRGLRGGDIYRTYSPVKDELCDLTEFSEIYTPDRELFAVIELKAKEHEPGDVRKESP